MAAYQLQRATGQSEETPMLGIDIPNFSIKTNVFKTILCDTFLFVEIIPRSLIF